jgi:hypothetical protein
VCTYCLTESGPKVARRELDPVTMLGLAREAKEVGFTSLGITGGQPYLVPELPMFLRELSQVLPVLVLTNGTLFQRALLDRVRPIIQRGRAATGAMGVVARYLDLEPELTITADGAFWSPFAPTVRKGVFDTNLLLTRTVRPLQGPLDAMLTVVGARPEGADSTLNIR